MNEDNKKTCFIITPIGKENTPIYRHINGVIDECIYPVLSDKYDITVAHRINKPGSIYKQIIQEIYNADLVIANLTETNPNVMYELAFRHSINKPVIMIMEEGEYDLPFDVKGERTIFYNNDFQGALTLKESLKKMVLSIEKEKGKNSYSPIYDVIGNTEIQNNIIKKLDNKNVKDISEFKYILGKLDEIQSEVAAMKMRDIGVKEENISNKQVRKYIFKRRLRKKNIEETYGTLKEKLDLIEFIYNVTVKAIDIDENDIVTVTFSCAISESKNIKEVLVKELDGWEFI